MAYNIYDLEIWFYQICVYTKLVFLFFSSPTRKDGNKNGGSELYPPVPLNFSFVLIGVD